MFSFFKKEERKENIEILKKEWESLEKTQQLLDHRYQSKAMSFESYNSQCAELGKKREKLRKKLGYDIYE